MRIDSHQHFWKVGRGDYPWMNPADPVLSLDYMPQDIKPHLAKHKIDRTILVQAAPTTAWQGLSAGSIWSALTSPNSSRAIAKSRNS